MRFLRRYIFHRGDAYKIHRPATPDELKNQLQRVRQLVRAFNIPVFELDGFEADDILGTLAKRAARDGMQAIIVTGDSDAFQLIEPNIKVFTSGRMYQDTLLYDESLIRERFGLAPQQLIDFKALKGDTSDNVPGVKGIGEKGATQLLQQYSTVENIYDHLADVTPTRAKSALEANRDMTFLSKDLVTIRIDVPLDVAWQDCGVHAYDRARVETLFDELEFKSLRNRLPGGGEVKKEAAPAAQMQQISMFGETDASRKASEPPAVSIDRPSITTPIVVDDDSKLKSLVGSLKKADFIAFDT